MHNDVFPPRLFRLFAILLLTTLYFSYSSAACSNLTCESLTWSTLALDDGRTICAERDADPLSSCEQGNFASARAFCGSVGARLCTYSEIFQGAGENTGCSFNTYNIWTSDMCDMTADDSSAIGYVVTRGTAGYCSVCVDPSDTSGTIGDGQENDPESCTTSDSNRNMGFTCCADVENCSPHPTQLPSEIPTHMPTTQTWKPTVLPTPEPSSVPIPIPSLQPSSAPTKTYAPTPLPSIWCSGGGLYLGEAGDRCEECPSGRFAEAFDTPPWPNNWYAATQFITRPVDLTISP